MLKKLTYSVNRIFVRQYAFKSELKIKWKRPEKIPCYDPSKSGDQEKLPIFSENEILRAFRNSKELESADPSVRKLFEMKIGPRKEMTNIVSTQMIEKVQRHSLDYGSMESKLAFMTANILNLQEIMNKFPRNKKVKVQLKELIDRRKKCLKYLRRWDYKRFEWVIEKLNIVYKSPPTEFHWITRKDSLRKLTDIYCNTIRNELLMKYCTHLKSQHIDFLTKKILKLQFIRKTQIEYSLPITVSNEEIEAIRKELSDQKKMLNEK